MSNNILIVEDSAVMREVIKKTVLVSGISEGEILEAENGYDGLQQARKHWVDLVFTDLKMPRMDGMRFISELKKNEVLSSIPVVVISQEGRDYMVGKALDLGTIAYITKPFRPEQIQRIALKELGDDNEQ